MKGSEVADPPETGLLDVKIGVWQVSSFGPNSMNVIDPVGLTPPDRVALSLIAPPMSMALLTVSFSPVSPHVPATATFALSPLYEAIQWYVPGAPGVILTGPYVPFPPVPMSTDLVSTRVPDAHVGPE